MRLRDSSPEGFVTSIEHGPQLLLAQPSHHFFGIRTLLRMHGQNTHLLRRKPRGQASVVMLEQNAEEPFQAADHGTMQHGRPQAHAGAVVVGELEALRQYEVELNGSALPPAAVPIAQLEFELRTVKRAFARFELTAESRASCGVFQGTLRAIPELRPSPRAAPAESRS